MNLVFIFLAKYLIYLLAAWAVVSGWYLRRGHGYRRYAFWLAKLALAIVLVTIIDQLINTLYPTDRPFIVNGVESLISHEADSSFPSTHAAHAASLATFIFSLRRSWGVVAFLVAVLVGAGRVLVGLHFPVDVVAGFAIGVVVSSVVIKFWPRKWA